MKNLVINNNSLVPPTVSRLGLGTMRMPGNKAAGVQAIHAALDAGITYLNTGDFYAAGESELIVGEALKGQAREKAFVSVKFGGLLQSSGGLYGIDSRPEAVENYLAYSLKRLGLDYVDLYEPCRINPHVPVEDTIGAVARLVEKGLVRTVGISEVDAATLRRAHATHPISLVEVTYSLMSRKIEDELLPTARELGIGVVGFGVLLSGLLGGSNAPQKMAHLQHMLTPDTLDNFHQNLALSEALTALAAEKNATLAQLAIAWVLTRGEDLVALVGCRTPAQVHDAVRALAITLTADDLARIEQLVPKANAQSDYMPALNLAANGLFQH